jgi:hypothetical protein
LGDAVPAGWSAKSRSIGFSAIDSAVDFSVKGGGVDGRATADTMLRRGEAAGRRCRTPPLRRSGRKPAQRPEQITRVRRTLQHLTIELREAAIAKAMADRSWLAAEHLLGLSAVPPTVASQRAQARTE